MVSSLRQWCKLILEVNSNGSWLHTLPQTCSPRQKNPLSNVNCKQMLQTIGNVLHTLLYGNMLTTWHHAIKDDPRLGHTWLGPGVSNACQYTTQAMMLKVVSQHLWREAKTCLEKNMTPLSVVHNYCMMQRRCKWQPFPCQWETRSWWPRSRSNGSVDTAALNYIESKNLCPHTIERAHMNDNIMIKLRKGDIQAHQHTQSNPVSLIK